MQPNKVELSKTTISMNSMMNSLMKVTKPWKKKLFQKRKNILVKQISVTLKQQITVLKQLVIILALNEPCFSLEAFRNMKQKIIMRKMYTRDEQEYQVLCIPQILIKPLLAVSHTALQGGHFGRTRYYFNMSRKYFGLI